VRITHKTTGIVVSMQDEKSQLQNRDKADAGAAGRLLEQQIAEQQGQIARAAKPRSQWPAGEKVRTYNFPQAASPTTGSSTLHNSEGVPPETGARRVHERPLGRGEAGRLEDAAVT